MHYQHLTTIIFDVDDTLTHNNQVDPRLLRQLQSIQSYGLRLAICTSRSLAEGVDFITCGLGSAIAPNSIFNGGLILEDGHVWFPPEAADLTQIEIITNPAAQAEMAAFRAAFAAAWRPCDEPDLREKGWGMVASVNESLVQEIPTKWATLGSVTIWKERRDVGWPHYLGEHDAFTDWALTTAAHLELCHTDVYETGAASLRVVEHGLNKGTALERLGFDLARTLFIGDGLNDLPVVKAIQAQGGMVMAVANAIDSIQAAANVISTQPYNAGVVELLILLEEELR